MARRHQVQRQQSAEGSIARRVMRRMIGGIVGLAAPVVLGVVLLGYGGPIWFELDLLAHFRLHLAILAVVLAGAAVLVRNRGALWRSAAAAVLAAAGLVPLWQGPLWQEPAAAGRGTPVTVMTANLYFWNPAPRLMRRALLAADADILVTAETTRAERDPGGLDEHYPYHQLYPTGGEDLRTALWSRFPIIDGAMILPENGAPAGVLARIEVAPGQVVTVLGLHLSHVAFGEQGRQIEALQGIAADIAGPLIVMGDLNATAWSHAVRRLEEITGTRRIGGVGRTWHGGYDTWLGRIPEPLGLPIDHILVSPGIGVRSAGTAAIPGSDHLAVRAMLSLASPEEPSARAAPALSVARDGTGESDAAGDTADGQGE
jgi:endonuclease/exonuclease/phosphatase (EEP) superfamily protein YafD